MMLPFDWLRQLRQRLSSLRPTATGRRGTASPLPARRSLRPRLESLEDRITPTTFAPTQLSDGVSGGGVVKTLRDAVLAFNSDSGTAADTIQLAAGTYMLSIANTNGHDGSGKQGDLNIFNSTSHDLVIQGVTDASGKPATIIDQTAADRVFQIINPGSTVTFRNVIIENGFTQDDGTTGAAAGSTEAQGGGILDDGGNVTLTNVVLQSNKAQASSGKSREGAAGGGIYVQAGSLSITNSILRNNRAYGSDATSTVLDGGGAEGGGVYFATGTSSQLSITNSTVVNNLVEGGSAYLYGNGNGGNAFGGGIDTFSATVHVLIKASTLTGNQAIGGDGYGTGYVGEAYGGGAFFQAATVTLINSTVAGNDVGAGSGQIASNGPFIAMGGGLQFEQGDATLTNVTVVGNKAVGTVDTAGGGIQGSATNITLTNTLVALNTAGYAPDYNGTVSTSSHNLVGNASGSGGFSAAHGDLLGTTANPLNPQLGPLANNGGPTMTLALLPGSPAIAKGDPNVQSATGPYDQRGPGFARETNGSIDIGAYEFTQPRPSGGSGSGGTTATPPSLFQALMSLYIDGIYFQIDSLLNQATTAVQADIDHYLPYAGPFGALFELAGRIAVLHTLQH